MTSRRRAAAIAVEVQLDTVGRSAEALPPIEEAVTIRRQLAQAAPDAYLPDLAASLTNYSAQLELEVSV